MNVGKTLFAQIMEFVPWTSFARFSKRPLTLPSPRGCLLRTSFRCAGISPLLSGLPLAHIFSSPSVRPVLPPPPLAGEGWG
ncbi:MAG: DUF4372 domain-containing protein, partial [Azonexus sp.]|nr:DUF4372 domain-containing protein [Azonexus sp.]